MLINHNDVIWPLFDPVEVCKKKLIVYDGLCFY